MPSKTVHKQSRTLFAARVAGHAINVGVIARKTARDQEKRIASLESTLLRIKKTAVSARFAENPNNVQQTALDEIALACAIELM
jgi:hypothetical protein